MISSSSRTADAPPSADRYERLRSTRTFRGDAHVRWARSLIAVIGCGNLGSHFAPEVVRSGASVWICDMDRAGTENLGTQAVRAGTTKVESVLEVCDRIAPGRARGVVTHVLHAGIGALGSCDLLVDCTDDPGLAFRLTEISTGLEKPLLRLAVDGSGERELGRVLASHGGAGHACQLCSYGARDLERPVEPQPCPGRAGPGRAPTFAGGALGMTIAGTALVQAQRVLGGNDAELVIDREILVDLTSFEITTIKLQRSSGCISGHRTWRLTPAELHAAEATPGDIFSLAHGQLRATDVQLEPYAHPLCLEARCECGAHQRAIGSVWAAAPDCPRCGRAMTWRGDVKLPRFSESQARELGILDTPLARLGLPPRGALLVAISPGRPALRLLMK